jgi:hypothetical protein
MTNFAICDVNTMNFLGNQSGNQSLASGMCELTFAEIEEISGGTWANGSVSGFGYTLSNGGNWANTAYQTGVWATGGAIAGSFGGFAGAGIGAFGGALAGFGGSFSLYHTK